MITQDPLRRFFDDYISECQFSSRLRPETIRGYQAVFDLFSLIVPEATTTDTLTPEILTEFFKRLQTRERTVGRDTKKSGVKNSTVKTYWSKLNAFFKWLHRKDLIEANPLANTKPPQPVYDDERALEESDVHKIISAISSHATNPLALRRDLVMVYLLLFCGLRLGEFISLQVRDIDMEKRILTVRGETSKSKKTRSIPIHPTLLMHLKDYMSERNKHNCKTQYLIVSTNSDRELSRQGLKHWVKSLVKKSGVNFHLHRFRHTFACRLATQDVSAFKIQKLMGHASLLMTSRYIRSIRNEDLAEDIAKMSV